MILAFRVTAPSPAIIFVTSCPATAARSSSVEQCCEIDPVFGVGDRPDQKLDTQGRICNPTLPLYGNASMATTRASNHVEEVAGELGIPLLHDERFAKSLSLDVAGRYTDYSRSGGTETWKIGFVYQIVDDFRLRGTESVDIRAPTLNDLFQPEQLGSQGIVDLHTSTSNIVYDLTEGNPKLVPEVARTKTIGAVFTPRFAPGLSLSVDYYVIRMANAIGTIDPSSTAIQSLCESSGGTSSYCSLYIRPFPFSNHTAANFPTQILTESLNTALTEIRGTDLEGDYHFGMSKLVRAWRGDWALRVMANYQPTNYSVAFPGAPLVSVAAPDGRITGFASYMLDRWTVVAEDRWLSGYSQITTAGQVWAKPHVGSFNQVDLTLQRGLEAGGAAVDVYLNVQNLLNSTPPIVPSRGAVGLYFPVPPGEDIMGRYFTVGVRAEF